MCKMEKEGNRQHSEHCHRILLRPNPTQPSSGDAGKKESKQDLPRCAKDVLSILKAMGIVNHDPRVVPQLLEFCYRYVGDVLEDATYNDFDITLTNLHSLASTNAVSAVPCRVLCTTLLDDPC